MCAAQTYRKPATTKKSTLVRDRRQARVETVGTARRSAWYRQYKLAEQIRSR